MYLAYRFYYRKILKIIGNTKYNLLRAELPLRGIQQQNYRYCSLPQEQGSLKFEFANFKFKLSYEKKQVYRGQIIKTLKENEPGRSILNIARKQNNNKSTIYYWSKKHGIWKPII